MIETDFSENDNCIIVANGQFPTSERPLKLLNSATAIIACDGAVKNLYDIHIAPMAIVGDLDSIPRKLRDLYSERIHHVDDQEINDLTKAVRFAHHLGYKRITIIGATGLREDHTLGNISLLMEYAPLFDKVEMISDFGSFTPILKSTTFQSFPRQQVSIFALYPEGEISTEGLRWPICHRTLTAWWQGSLNEAIGDSFTIHLAPQCRILVYQTLFPKE